MEAIRIRCGDCGKSWIIRWSDIRADDANICPFCRAKIDRHIWESSVITAAAAALDANMELERDSAGYKKPLFAMDFLYQNI